MSSRISVKDVERAFKYAMKVGMRKDLWIDKVPGGYRLKGRGVGGVGEYNAWPTTYERAANARQMISFLEGVEFALRKSKPGKNDYVAMRAQLRERLGITRKKLDEMVRDKVNYFSGLVGEDSAIEIITRERGFPVIRK
jgi:hypothetical protein